MANNSALCSRQRNDLIVFQGYVPYNYLEKIAWSKKFDKSIHIHYNVFVAKKGLFKALKYCDRMVTRQLKTAYHAKRGCSLVVKLQPSKLMLWVRFPSPAPFFCLKRLSVTQDVKNLAIPTQKVFFIWQHIALFWTAGRRSALPLIFSGHQFFPDWHL